MNVESRNPGVHALLLGGIALVAAVFLIIGNLFTTEPIKQRKYEDLVRSLEIVVPPRLHDNDITTDILQSSDRNGKPFRLHIARKSGKVSAVAFEQYINGYAKIHLVMGIAADGEVLGVRVLAHEETPGLGDQIEIKKSDWIRGFDGLSLDNTPRADWNVKKDGGKFDQFSGATITPRAVVKAVHEGLEFFHFRKRELLASKAPDALDHGTITTKGGAGS